MARLFSASTLLTAMVGIGTDKHPFAAVIECHFIQGSCGETRKMAQGSSHSLDGKGWSSKSGLFHQE